MLLSLCVFFFFAMSYAIEEFWSWASFATLFALVFSDNSIIVFFEGGGSVADAFVVLFLCVCRVTRLEA